MKMATVLATKGPGVFTTTAAALVTDAVRQLAANNIGALIVLDAHGLPEGILSERDLVRALAEGGALGGVVGDLMTSPITVGGPNDDVESVLRTMTARHFRHLPIVEDGRLAGMVTIADLVHAQLNEALGAVHTLETQIMGS
jgi:CBS domain-containing protein